MMGAVKLEEEYRVRDFKSKFVGGMAEYGRVIKVKKPFLFKIGKNGLKLMNKIS